MATAPETRSPDRLTEAVSLVSHELRTPLTLINGYVSTLLHVPDLTEQEQRHYLNGIAQANARLSALVDTLLDLSVIEAGRLKLHLTEVYVDQLARRLVRQTQAQADQHLLRVDSPRPLPPVRCDSGRVEQVLTNLLANAVKYAPRGGVIEMRLRVLDSWDQLNRPWSAATPAPVGELLLVQVCDQGSGITPADLPRLFQKYQRGAGHAAQAVRGVGLGLYLCRMIVEAHGGAIWAENRAGGGSCFAFCLPVNPSEASLGHQAPLPVGAVRWNDA